MATRELRARPAMGEPARRGYGDRYVIAADRVFDGTRMLEDHAVAVSGARVVVGHHRACFIFARSTQASAFCAGGNSRHRHRHRRSFPLRTCTWSAGGSWPALRWQRSYPPDCARITSWRWASWGTLHRLLQTLAQPTAS
jgi:hypothetical protein